ncbi:MAG: hypothetical protein HRT61_01300 [Ekhidna sp.]|nr:hypothetical protein [Ekhidna sp.]
MKRIYFIICLVAYQGITQPTDTLKTHILSPAEMREDFNTYRRMIEETHPGLYRYASKLEIQHQLDSLSNAFSESMPYYTFYRAIADFNGKIKCAHSYAIPMQSIDQYLIAKCKTVPFYLHGIGDQLFVIFNGSTNEEIKPGYEITSINNRSVDEIRKQIYRFGWSDAEIETAKVKYMSGAYFWMMYYLFIEQPETFNIQYKNLEGKEGEIKLPAQLPRVTMANYKKNPVNSEMLRLLKRNKLANPYRIDILKEPTNTAVLTLSAFGGRGMHDEDVAQQSTRKFMNKAMKKMQKAGTESLIIDLRYNGGGWDRHGNTVVFGEI